MADFLAEVDAIKGQLRARVTLYACDLEMDPEGPWTYEAWEEFTMPKEFGGGGTDFKPAFAYLERHGIRPDTLVYFTDADGAFPVIEPNYPVIWLVKGRKKVPWGQRVQLN